MYEPVAKRETSPHASVSDSYIDKKDNIKRLRLESPMSDADRTNKNPRLDRFEALDPAVREKLCYTFKEGILKENDLDDASLKRLNQLSPLEAISCIEKFCNCDLTKVRNKSAYIIGVMRNIENENNRHHHHYSHYHPHHHPHHHQHFNHPHPIHIHPIHHFHQNNFVNSEDFISHPDLNDNLKLHLSMLFNQGICKPSDIDEKCLHKLSEIPFPKAIEALSLLSRRNLSEIQSISRFLMSLIKKVMTKSINNSNNGNIHRVVPLVVPQPQMPRIDRRPTPVGVVPIAAAANMNMLIQNPIDYNPLQPTVVQSVVPNIIPQFINGRCNYAIEQFKLGVRVNEFHALSPHAVNIHPAIALKLQEMWDSGIKLVAVFDDRVWNTLAIMKAPEALLVIEEMGQELDSVKNPNSYFMTIVRRYERIHYHSNHHSSYRRRSESSYHNTRYEYRQCQPGDFTILTIEVRQSIDDLLRSKSRYVQRYDFDKGVVEELAKLTEKKAVDLLENLKTQNLEGINNMPAFIMSYIRKFRVADFHARR